MDSQEEILSFLDFLDLDEDIIDARLKSLMVRNNHSPKHLTSIKQLLLYKNLINIQEDTECDNEEEFDFIVKLIKEINIENVDKICEILQIVLCLNKTNIVIKSEHLLQQILSNIDCQSETSSNNVDKLETLINLKVCDSILDATIKNNERISLLFLETPLEKILDSGDDKIKMHFLTNTVPRLFEGVSGYNILDRIWAHIKGYKQEQKENMLKILCSLSQYYLPMPDNEEDCKYVSEIVFQTDFWSIILFGLESNDVAVRKLSIFLCKKAIDCIITLKRDITIQSGTKVLFKWSINNKSYKTMWDNFFILMDSLEEKQSNIVLPSLKLFETITIGENWLNCAYNIGLKHDNTLVRLKCIEHRLKTPIQNEKDTITILEALNDINIYDQRADYEILKQNISKSLEHPLSLTMFLKGIPLIKWSPVPLYHLTDVLADLKQNSQIFHQKIVDILQLSCNNVAIRQAVYTNTLNFIENCCPNIGWLDIANILSLDNSQRQKFEEIPAMIALIKMLQLKSEDIEPFYKYVTEDYKSIDFLLTYLSSHKEDIHILINIINRRMESVQSIVSRQYSDKKECLNEATFLMHLLHKTIIQDNAVTTAIGQLLVREFKTLLIYVQSLISSDAILTIEEMKALVLGFKIYGDDDIKEVLLQLYKVCVLLIKSTNLDKAVLSAFILRDIMKNNIFVNNYKHEMLTVKIFLKLVSEFKFEDSPNQSVGRLKNILYETTCEILYNLICEDMIMQEDIKDTINFVESVLECGGYGCLRFILKIVNKTVKLLLNEKAKFNMNNFINRIWNEIEELKSNNQYTPCIHEFIDLITNEAILEKSMYNNTVMLYCKNILEYGPVKNGPLYYLITVLQSKNLMRYGHLVYALCEILLYCPVARKDQRIMDGVTLEILKNPQYRLSERNVDVHFNFEIQNLAVAILSKIHDVDTIQVITSFIINRMNQTFRNKQRYHGNSQLHKVLLVALQHLLILLIKSRKDLETAFHWSFEMLVKLPHQPSVRICLEWYISLNLYIQNTIINDQMLQMLKTKNVPLISQFFIMYWLLKHKITNNTYMNGEYEFLMDFLLSHSMGQLFNVRLHAQYLATNLYHIAKPSPKYAYTIDIIEKTFAENFNDKNYVKLKKDYFANEFDIVKNVSPIFIYYVLPRYCGDNNNEEMNMDSIKCIMQLVNDNLRIGQDTGSFSKEWMGCELVQDFVNIEPNKEANSKSPEEIEVSGTIQKKYIPWKNMSDVNVYNVEKKRESPSELIVVASLIDKLPNLGGMARTSEVFGVKTYVVDSLRHLQDKQFQGLSVSAERWINVEEIRPGRALKEYLIKKKVEGYSVIAAEQTSNSSKLQAFKFPKKTLLLLGHEKEGIPCDLLPMMDHCVEIPQQGYVRSLNVHVTAAIFVWEYARQNIL